MTIFKEDIPLRPCVELRVPKGAKFLCVQVQRDIPRVWYAFDEKLEGIEIRQLRLITTGFSTDILDMDPNGSDFEYLGTFQLGEGGSFVGHIYVDVVS